MFTSFSKGDLTASVSFKHATQLTQEQKDAIWLLFENNMKDVYQADGQKWNPKEKKRELFDVSMNLRAHDARGLVWYSSAPLMQDEARYFWATTPGDQLLAFTHFRWGR